jgi:hypothetical protein
MNNDHKTVEDFLEGKPDHTCLLFYHFLNEYRKIGAIEVHPAKTMIGISNTHKRIAWITQLGKNFIHVIFPFTKPYPENLCFEKIAQVPGDAKQFNHHFRMYSTEDVNNEVIGFMRLAYNEGVEG